MSIRHAACRLDVCESTVRRWLRGGRLRSRVVAQGRRFSHQVLLQDLPRPRDRPTLPTDIVQRLRHQLADKEKELARLEEDLRRQEQQIQSLSAALARAVGRRDGSSKPGESPYEKYRWLARRSRRWWPFR